MFCRNVVVQALEAGRFSGCLRGFCGGDRVSACGARGGCGGGGGGGSSEDSAGDVDDRHEDAKSK